MQPSLLYTAFHFGNFCAAFIAAPNLFSTILQPSFLVSSPKVSRDSSLQPPLLYWFFEGIFWEIFWVAFIAVPDFSSHFFRLLCANFFISFSSLHCLFFLWPLLPLFLDRHQHQSCRTPSLQLLKENRLCSARLYFRIFSHLPVLKHQLWVCVH